METISLLNGNNQIMNKTLPKLIILDQYINDVALDHIVNNTGLCFKKENWNYEAQPTSSKQITALLMTYNFKTRYYDNWTHKNTLMLKSDHHVGFDVESICFECVKHNNINSNGLDRDSRLSC